MRRLYRSTTDKYLAGVFGGLGEGFGVDPNLLRLAAIFLGLVTAILPLVVTYLVAWAIIPPGPDEDE